MNKSQFDIHVAAHSSEAHIVLLTNKDHKKALLLEIYTLSRIE